MSAAARQLEILDFHLAKLECTPFPTLGMIRQTVKSARETLAEVIQEQEELSARIGLLEDERN